MVRCTTVALLVFVSGCDLSASPFAGTIIEMTLSGAQPNAPGEHLELWARTAHDDVVGVRASYEMPEGRLDARGVVIRPAISMGDPCMIDGEGHLLVTADAYPSTVKVAGVPQSPEEQAAQVRARIAQLTTAASCDGSGGNPASHCGREAITLFAVVPYEHALPDGTFVAPPSTPVIPFDTPPKERLDICSGYWATSPLAYTPNPAQLTAPLHGTVWGFVNFTTTAPPGNFNAIRMDSPERLVGIRELFFTVEPDQVDPHQRGPLYLQGTPGMGGNSWVHFDLLPPFGSQLAVAGAAALFVETDQYPTKF